MNEREGGRSERERQESKAINEREGERSKRGRK